MQQELLAKFKALYSVTPNFDLNDIRCICANPNSSDFEPLMDTKPFLGLRWDEVTPSVWHEAPAALSFFTPAAHAYFFPSFLYCSFIDHDQTELSLLSLETGLSHIYQYLLGEGEIYPYYHLFDLLTTWNPEQLYWIIRLMDYLVENSYYDEETWKIPRETVFFFVTNNPIQKDLST